MTHLTDWQRGYQAGAREARTQASIASGQRLLRVRLRTYLKEDR